MKPLVAAIPAAVVAAFFVGVHAETPWFAPKAADIVTFASSSTTISAGQSITVATVPSNKKLVITDINVFSRSGGTVGIDPLQIEERDSAGTVTLKVPETVLQYMGIYAAAAHSDGHGIAFDSGSDVVFKFNVNAGGTCVFCYFLNGYLTEK